MKKILGVELAKLIKEATQDTLASSQEEFLQQRKVKALSPYKSSKTKSSDEEVDEQEDAEEEKKEEPKKSEKTPVQKEETPKVSAAGMIDLLNQIRSGVSLGDEHVRKNFQRYFNALDGKERLALHSFLKAILNLVQTEAGEEADTSIQPSSSPYNLDIKLDDKKKKAKQVAAKGRDDEAPIVVGEVASKHKEKRILKSNS